MKKTLTLLMAAVIAPCTITPPILANSLDVNRIDTRAQRDAFRPGEVIIKLKNQGTRKAAALKTSRGAVNAYGTSSQLSDILSKYGAKSAEELMPLTGATVTPVQKRAKAFNGDSVAGTPIHADNKVDILYVLSYASAIVPILPIELLLGVERRSRVLIGTPQERDSAECGESKSTITMELRRSDCYFSRLFINFLPIDCILADSLYLCL